ncbi:subtilisin-like protease SBT5.6 isoform X1 [Salvia splendens]|uniref:subtilisin-like protease SBT5.6 isoform X1 n=1 Tax=Salvia splendens TaxID=180675 RepID=UPI001101AAA2|nr:subtilisin-like protease SBT5.6 isoform X1 [Salvia splendens]
MENFHPSLFLLLLLLPLLVSTTENQVYIVYFGEHSGEKTLQQIEENHHSYLLSVKENEDAAKSSLVYSYKHTINGFAALLSPLEASKLSKMEEVVSVLRSHPRKYEIHTTRSWEFAGVEEAMKSSENMNKEDIWLKSSYGKDVIVGLLDNGVWPESESFNDEGMGPIPKSWKGICQTGDEFNSSNCNKKIIGARYYIKGYEAYYGPLNRTLDYLSPRDKDGHGTHTSSTAAGRRVTGISALGGFASGTASGGAPLARLAIYKVCWAVPGHGKEDGNTCFEEDMLAAIDDAVADGVDVLSISIGTKDSLPFNQDGIAIGALHAVKQNVVVACSAGNSGPTPSTLSNPAPWIITVAASSVDRIFLSPAVLGNGMKLPGQTVTPHKLQKKLYPLVYAGQVANPDVPKNLSGQCLPGSLSSKTAKGKIVLCLRGNGTRVGKGMEVKRAGGIGFILGNSLANGDELAADAHILPATAVNYQNSLKIMDYIHSSKTPTAYIVPGTTVLDIKPAPFMAAFSSRGPSDISPEILKPDITAPGLNILAAWSEASSPTKLEADKRVVKYNILSGTSMSCPHIGGAAALLKAMHPRWSSAAIRSALITSAGQKNNQGSMITDASSNPADPFQYGGGHFRPAKAADPGLVYDASYTDYLLYLCSIGVKIDYTFTCPKHSMGPLNLNYPTLAIPRLRDSVTLVRTVTNVGGSKSIYFVSMKPPLGILVKIWPPILHFNRVGEKRNFTITVKVADSSITGKGEKPYGFGWYMWSDGIHNVRSPMAVSVA